MLKIIYLENYEWKLGAALTSGVDIWLNTPRRPFEASGTSGMKAALNGVPSLSVLDGWWVEGCIEGVTGWAIPDADTQEQEVTSLYDRLEGTIMPLYYGNPRRGAPSCGPPSRSMVHSSTPIACFRNTFQTPTTPTTAPAFPSLRLSPQWRSSHHSVAVTLTIKPDRPILSGS